jgi:glycosyltransferase involved in cell wall biosynthesis
MVQETQGGSGESGSMGRSHRVLQIIAMLQSGGPERWMVDLCPAGRKWNLAMDIAVVHQAEGLFGRRARELGIPVYFCDPGNNPLVFIRNFRALIRKHGPYDAVHCHLHAYSGFAALVAWAEGIPARVVHSHNVVRNTAGTTFRKAYIRLARFLIGRFATAGLAPSTASAADLFGPNWQSDPRWGVMPCGIDLTPFQDPLSTACSREEFGIPSGALVLGSVGRLTAEKNSELLVDILAAVLRKQSNAYLLLVGEGPLRERLEQKAQEGAFRERLILPGTRTDVAALMRGVMDVFVFPSPPPPRGNEALPIAVAEAQAAGLPTVISDGVTEESIIVPDLVVRLAADAGAEAWAAAVLGQARIERNSLANKAWQTVQRSNFNCLRNVEFLASLYRDPRTAPKKR